MDAVNASSRDSVATFGMARKESRKSIVSRFMEALKESRRREARRVITTYAYLVADSDILEDEDQR
ncbi:MAG: hypothetical protein WAJ88_14465 [Pseudolabrys sp.]